MLSFIVMKLPSKIIYIKVRIIMLHEDIYIYIYNPEDSTLIFTTKDFATA